MKNLHMKFPHALFFSGQGCGGSMKSFFRPGPRMIITNTQAISTLKAAACQETFFVAALSVGMARVLVVIISGYRSL